MVQMILRLGAVILLAAAAGKAASKLRMPAVLGFLIAGIALATAPASALSIVTEYKTDGPVTRTLIPLAVIDDVIAICVFLTVMGVILQKTAEGSVPGYLVILVVLYPVLIGAVTGNMAAWVMKRISSPKVNGAVVFAGVVLTGTLTFLANQYLMPVPILNFMLSGMVILPHSGVSLVLTGIAISALTGDYRQYGDIVRGTIAAAAVINEIIAVFVARKGFQLAGEMGV